MEKKLQSISSFIIFSIIFLLANDSYRGIDSVQKVIGIPAYSLVLPVLLIALVLRLKFEHFLPRTTVRFLQCIFLFGLIGGSALSVYDFSTSPNNSYAMTLVYQPHVWLIAVYSGLLLLLNKSNVWWERNWKRVIFLTPGVLLFFALMLRLFNSGTVFVNLLKEDSLVEWLQFFTLVSGVILSVKFWLRSRKGKHFFRQFFFIMCLVCFLLAAGDEIAWGQRLLGFSISENLKELNRQEELTVHNLYAVEWTLVYSYVTVSGLGFASNFWARKNPVLEKYAPLDVLGGFFFFPFILYVQQLFVRGGIWWRWAELAELFLYVGVVLWIFFLGQDVFRNHQRRGEKILKAGVENR